MLEQYIPIKDRVLVQLDRKEEKSIGGIIIPDTAGEEKYCGKVLGVGEEVEYVKDGDRIVFGKYSGSKIGDDCENLLVICEEDVLAVIVEMEEQC